MKTIGKLIVAGVFVFAVLQLVRPGIPVVCPGGFRAKTAQRTSFLLNLAPAQLRRSLQPSSDRISAELQNHRTTEPLILNEN